VIRAETRKFQYVAESSETFPSLFPCRYDFIYAPYPKPNQRPEWQSESRYPLSDRKLLAGEYLYGVRFQKKTQYFLLDIDSSSPYHPQQSPLALERLLSVLEPVGITDHIICTSSDSKGLHVYFPLNKPFNSWKLAKAISIALESAGFKLKPGQLELFPNVKAYANDTPTLFNAHRLPLQIGSYALDNDFNPVNSSQTYFVHIWRNCQKRNILNVRYLNSLLKKAQQVYYRLSIKASKFLNDLNTEIEQGWTEKGQTNRLLGRITMRTFVFNHIIEGGNPLEGDSLVAKTVAVAEQLPGYKTWCGHQHEIRERATEWARCIENSRYFPYGLAKGKYKAITDKLQATELSWNQKKATETKEKINTAVEDLKEKGQLPDKATARFKALLTYNIGGGSLYRYRELWHPIEENSFLDENKESGLQKKVPESVCAGGANALKNPTSLLHGNAGNVPGDTTSSDPEDEKLQDKDNNLPESTQFVRDRIRQRLVKARTAQKNTSALLDIARNDVVVKAARRQAIQRMRDFLLSGEPILLAEVGRWLIKQPEAVHKALLLDDDDHIVSLLRDLAAIAQALVRVTIPPWEVRTQLEVAYGKSLILELTSVERQEWRRQLIDDFP